MFRTSLVLCRWLFSIAPSCWYRIIRFGHANLSSNCILQSRHRYSPAGTPPISRFPTNQTISPNSRNKVSEMMRHSAQVRMTSYYIRSFKYELYLSDYIEVHRQVLLNVRTKCALVHYRLHIGCIYRVLAPHELKNQVVNLYNF